MDKEEGGWSEQFSNFPMPPIVDERYTVRESMIESIKRELSATKLESITVTFDMLKFESIKDYEIDIISGDVIKLIDERMGVDGLIRIVEMTVQRDSTGYIYNVDFTLGDYDEHYKQEVGI